MLNNQTPRRTAPDRKEFANRSLASVILMLALNWPIMVLIGVFHSSVPQVPALGYWTTLVGVVILDLVHVAIDPPRGD